VTTGEPFINCPSRATTNHRARDSVAADRLTAGQRRSSRTRTHLRGVSVGKKLPTTAYVTDTRSGCAENILPGRLPKTLPTGLSQCQCMIAVMRGFHRSTNNRRRRHHVFFRPSGRPFAPISREIRVTGRISSKLE